MRKKNKERAQRVANVLELYKKEQLEEVGPVDETTLQDLLTDIRHYCVLTKLPFPEIVDAAEVNYGPESRGEE